MGLKIGRFRTLMPEIVVFLIEPCPEEQSLLDAPSSKKAKSPGREKAEKQKRRGILRQVAEMDGSSPAKNVKNSYDTYRRIIE